MKHLIKYNEEKIEIPESILSNLNLTVKGICMYVSEIITKYLISINYGDFEVIEGYVIFKEPFYHKAQHTWIRLNDGTIIDPSLIQFHSFNLENVERKTKTKYSGETYLKLCLRYPISEEDIKMYTK